MNDYVGAAQGQMAGQMAGGLQRGPSNKISEMDHFLSRLEKAVSGLTNNRASLCERLAPVLAREVPQGAIQPALAEVGRLPCSPVTEQLRNIVERIEGESSILGGLLDRLTT